MAVILPPLTHQHLHTHRLAMDWPKVSSEVLQTSMELKGCVEHSTREQTEQVAAKDCNNPV